MIQPEGIHEYDRKQISQPVFGIEKYGVKVWTY